MRGIENNFFQISYIMYAFLSKNLLVYMQIDNVMITMQCIITKKISITPFHKRKDLISLNFSRRNVGSVPPM